ncbi:MAG TPA: YciI family protein [Casimicrobiaceae bacterium]|nr:YciI family protein [Casimicrobiaceae bacterium]
MKFVCLIAAEKVMEHLAPEDAAQHFDEYRRFTTEVRESGQLLGCHRLLPADTATTVRVRDGRTFATDGPFAETKEQIGGFYLIDALDRDDAVRIACRIPGARRGSVEVRRIAEDPQTRAALDAPEASAGNGR